MSSTDTAAFNITDDYYCYMSLTGLLGREISYIIEAVGKFVCDLFKEDLFKLKFYSVKTSS